jgi:peptidylprolyl isomerase
MATKVAPMATTKRERQKAARRQKLEQMERANKRRKNIRRGVIVAIVAALVVGSAALLFSSKSTPPTTTTTTTQSTTPTVATTTTTLPPISIGTIADPSPAGTFGKEPTMVIPPGAPPTKIESANLITGTGTVARDGDTLTVEYVLGTYSSRKVVQTSWTGQPFVVNGLNTTTVIPGWVYGVAGMRVGGRRELIIPPALGYGDSSPGGGISKNDTLVFIIDLEKVETP